MQITNSTATKSASYNQTLSTYGTNQDSQLKSIQGQIENLQNQLQNLSNNKEMSAAEKLDKQKELQQQLQDLSKQMEQRKLEMQQEKREKANVEDNSGNDESEASKTGMDTQEMGYIISFSSAKDQMAGMGKIKTELEGRLRTASSEEEKTKLQAKVNSITKAIFTKANETNEAISDYQKQENEVKEV
ncbi:FlxA-like family protein [Paenibacillus sp. BAC0078]